MVRLHTVSGWADLKARPSTAVFADIALGHHSWYDGSDGYPADYVRTASPYRQMTDAVALVSYLLDSFTGDLDALADDILHRERGRFSPQAAAALSDGALRDALGAILRGDDRQYYETIYRELLAK